MRDSWLEGGVGREINIREQHNQILPFEMWKKRVPRTFLTLQAIQTTDCKHESVLQLQEWR